MKFLIKSLSFSLLILFSTQSLAVTVSDAINASKSDEPAEAVKIWKQLAKAGNSVAQYNLANHYLAGEGVQKNESTAEQWLRNATHSGLIQAYVNLNKKGVTPAKGVTLSFNVSPLLWLEKQEPNKYTIQVASSRYEKSIKKSFEENNVSGKGGYYRYVRGGVDRYALIYGAYRTVAAANVAIKKLPKNLRKKNPWIRKIKSIQKISK